MANRNKNLGTGLEVRVVNRAKKRGIEAKRQPGSGIFKAHPNDVLLRFEAGQLLDECKVRSTPPSLAQMLSWLDGAEANAARMGMLGAFLTYNHKGAPDPHVLLRLDLFLDLLARLPGPVTTTTTTAPEDSVCNELHESRN